jgi:hypothetical protein
MPVPPVGNYTSSSLCGHYDNDTAFFAPYVCVAVRISRMLQWTTPVPGVHALRGRSPPRSAAFIDSCFLPCSAYFSRTGAVRWGSPVRRSPAEHRHPERSEGSIPGTRAVRGRLPRRSAAVLGSLVGAKHPSKITPLQLPRRDASPFFAKSRLPPVTEHGPSNTHN